MYTVTCESIRAHNPCYDPNRFLPEVYCAPLQEFLTLVAIPPQDRIWVAVKHLNDKDLRLFAVDCAARAIARINNPDPRSVTVIEVARRYAHGEATLEELDAARSAAQYAESAAWSAARSAEYAERSAASSTMYAAWSAAQSAQYAEYAAQYAEYAAQSAAWSAAWSAAQYAAQYAEREAQIKWLISCLGSAA